MRRKIFTRKQKKIVLTLGLFALTFLHYAPAYVGGVVAIIAPGLEIGLNAFWVWDI